MRQWNPKETSLSKHEWDAIHARPWDDFPEDEPEDAMDLQPYNAMAMENA